MQKITRTIPTTKATFTAKKDGKVTEEVFEIFGEKIEDEEKIEKLARKAYKNSDVKLGFIDKVEYLEDFYEISVEDFIKVATKVEK